MISRLRSFAFSLLLSMIPVISAHADLEGIRYLVALDEELASTSPDAITVLKVKRKKASTKSADKTGPQHLSLDLFMDYMREKYPASHRVYEKISEQQREQVYASYQTHLDINRSRKEMLKLWRKK